MNIFLIKTIKSFAAEHVAPEGYETSSEYARELISRDKDRRQLKAYLMDGLESGTAGVMDETYFAILRAGLTCGVNPAMAKVGLKASTTPPPQTAKTPGQT